MKKTIAVALIVILAMSVFAGCNSDNSNAGGNESSYYSWVGQFDLEKIELNENIFVKKDFPSLNFHTDQHITLNMDYSGELAISCYTDDSPLETLDIKYEYDMLYQSGYLFVDGSSGRIRFTLQNGVLVFEVLGATWTFQKQG